MNDRSHAGTERTPEQIRQQYEVEKELSNRLRLATRAERRTLYATVYDELFTRVLDHPQLTRKASPEEKERAVQAQMCFLRPFLGPDVTFLEVGAGDCALSLEAAALTRQVYAVDVSDEITRNLAAPPNFRLVMSDGCSIPVPPGSANVAYSNQLMEHLHPDDAREQLQNLYASLAPGGVYCCVTPNRLNGPHDVSRGFDEVATGFHLKEYIITDLAQLFTQVGFSEIKVHYRVGRKYVGVPVTWLRPVEWALARLPTGLRRAISHTRLFRSLLTIRLSGRK